MTDPVARSIVVGWPSGWGHPTLWQAAALLALAMTACTGGLAEPDVTDGSLALTGSPTPITAPAVDVPVTTVPLVVDPNVDPVLGFVPPIPAEPIVEHSLGYLEYVAECVRAAGYQVELVATANPGLVWKGSSTPRRREVGGRCKELPEEKGWLIPSPFDGGDEGNRLLYDIRVEIYDCLVANGYPTVEPPSEEVFVEEGETSWNPYEGMIGDKLFVDPNTNWGPTGTMPGDVKRQLRAQELCGASETDIYVQRLAQGDGS